MQLILNEQGVVKLMSVDMYIHTQNHDDDHHDQIKGNLII